MAKQALLDLFNREYEFSNYISCGNELVVGNLQNFSNQFTHIYGDSLTGKTHLLKSWVNLANHRYNAGLYLTGSDLSQIAIRDIDLDTYRFIAIDNIDRTNDIEQIAIFDLFNLIKLNNRDNYLLTSASLNLNHSNMRIDLKTRIYSGVVFALKTLGDTELLAALQIYIKREGIKLGDKELQYILTHHTRNLGEILRFINQISLDAIREKKPITTHFIHQFL